MKGLGTSGQGPAPPRKVRLMFGLRPQEPRAALPSSPLTGLEKLVKERPGFRPGNLTQHRVGGHSAKQTGSPVSFGREWEWPGNARSPNNSQADSVHAQGPKSHVERTVQGLWCPHSGYHTPSNATDSQRDPDVLKPKLADFQETRDGFSRPHSEYRPRLFFL